jgi:hypothetical protein
MTIRPDYYKVQVPVTLADGSKVTATLECFDLIDTLANGDFYEGNALKYLFRAGRKTENRRPDVEKAITYLEQVKERIV